MGDARFDPYHQWLGIPPAQQPPDHYRLLGLEKFESDPAVIESAADRQMQHVRTFQSGVRGAEAQWMLNELSTARLVLLAPSRKSEYDARLSALIAQSEHAEIAEEIPIAEPALIPMAEIAKDTSGRTEAPSIIPEIDTNPSRSHEKLRPRRRPGPTRRQFLNRGLVFVALLVVVALLLWQLHSQRQAEIVAANQEVNAAAKLADDWIAGKVDRDGVDLQEKLEAALADEAATEAREGELALKRLRGHFMACLAV